MSLAEQIQVIKDGLFDRQYPPDKLGGVVKMVIWR